MQCHLPKFCLALDYLLASEGVVHGTFNLSYYCLEIDDEEKITEEMIDGMRKVDYIPHRFAST